ncbi:putative oxidoreductase SadH [Hartmannibacter diazotrophicus]|uniref:Putative oxidoreductase SadH n=1 Tax=Hartmannibacter diazotrophicus TaxID=1482074 RepID=A0A2C9D6K6_9HYPH|nr:SDR family oxidoreductase [Hartmannibacter diazotrophicus]SON55145.1 putative oxidoreductase SadH [Hartmannibacter diazotrophicus]
MSQQLTGRTVVITGASAGVGRATALEVARRGARVGLIARDRQALADVQREIAAMGAKAAFQAVDVTDADALRAAAEALELELGPIDIWMNDAMVTVFSPVEKITPEEFARVTEVDYLGFVHGTMAALAQMRKRDKGLIIQIGSSLAYRGIPLQAAYCGAKHAIRGFTNSLRTELIRDKSGIRLTMVELPAVNTPQFDWARTHFGLEPRPVAPVFQPEAIARAIAGIAQRPGREHILGFSSVLVILGNMILPSFLDRYLARNAYDGQMRKTPVSEDRRDNLFAPVTELHRTRGAFSDEAADEVTIWPGTAVRLVAAGGGLLIAFALGLLVASLLT